MIEQDLFLWAEKNYTEQKMNSENKNEQGINDTTKNISINLMPNDWRNITDPKLRKKMRDKMTYEINKEKNKNYRNLNKDRIKKNQKKWYEANKEKIKIKSKKRYLLIQSNELTKSEFQKKIKDYYNLNKNKINIKRKDYLKINKDKINQTKRKYQKDQIKNNIQFKLARTLRRRLYFAIKNNLKSGSAVKDLGCTINELKIYLESKFLEGMTWKNYGLHGWHIDHIKPLSLFDLTKREQFLQAIHYTNLQPLWAKDNLSKGNKY